MEFKEIVKKLRKEYGLSQEELGLRIGMARSSVANYENGQNFPNTDVLLKLSEVFNCSVDYLLGKTEVKNESSIDSSLLKIGLDMKNYTPPTEEQKKQIEDFAKFVLKDNKKEN